MKVFFSLAVALTIGACSAPAPAGYPMVFDNSVGGVASELINPGSTYKARLDANDAKCREEASKPGAPTYTDCRHQLDSQIQ